MRRFPAVLLAALLATLLAIGLAACGSDDDSDAGASSTPAASTTADLGLTTPGVLTVASDIPYAPFEFTDPGSKEPKGFDVDLVKAIAATQGINDVRFVDQGFDSIILSIKQGRFDMSASAWTITPERAKQVAFGDGYFSANQAILVQADDDSVSSLDDLQGKTIGAQRGTVGADLGNTVEGATVKTYDTGDDAFNALAQGRVDAAITDFPVVAYAAAQKPTLKVAAEVPGNLQLGLMFPQGNAALREAFNAGLAEIRANGKYDEIYTTWFGDAPKGGSSTTGTTTQ
ncbi:MAG: basic amino acid ABC transporter substrate-binding protein [Thermoleophilia bacterium]